MSGNNKRKRDGEDAQVQGEPKSKAPRLELQERTQKPFRLLDLPAELRNNVYEKALEDDPVARLSRAKYAKTHQLQTSNNLVLVSRQVQDEFRGIMATDVRFVDTQVVDFNFAHVITYLNRLSDIDLKRHMTGERVLRIELTFSSEPSNVIGYGVESLDEEAAFQRWWKRLQSLKRGSRIPVEYSNPPRDMWSRHRAYGLGRLAGFEDAMKTVRQRRGH